MLSTRPSNPPGWRDFRSSAGWGHSGDKKPDAERRPSWLAEHTYQAELWKREECKPPPPPAPPEVPTPLQEPESQDQLPTLTILLQTPRASWQQPYLRLPSPPPIPGCILRTYWVLKGGELGPGFRWLASWKETHPAWGLGRGQGCDSRGLLAPAEFCHL